MRHAALPLWAEDLAAFVSAQLREHGVPGAAVVVIRGNRVVSAQGFGVTNAVTRRPVTGETVFPVASNGKAVAGYLAVRLLDLDAPVLQQAAAVDLPDTPQHRRITPRHLLTHTSGLGNFLRDRRRDVSFAPGERFAYSGVGFMVLQELLERRTGRTVDALMREYLPMPHAWFGERPSGVREIAAPHIAVSRALAPFTIVFAPLMHHDPLPRDGRRGGGAHERQRGVGAHAQHRGEGAGAGGVLAAGVWAVAALSADPRCVCTRRRAVQSWPR